MTNKCQEILERLDKKDEIYPNLEYPLTAKDALKLYDIFNKKYFSNELPKCRIKMAPLAKNFYGKYHHKYDTKSTNKKAAKDRLITLSTVTERDIHQFVDTLLHEQIHCWQYYMEETTGDSKYLDHSFFDFEKDIHKQGHGKFFVKHMERLNRLGFNIRIESDMQIDKEMSTIVYPILFEGDGKGVFVYSVKDPTDKILEIIENIETVAGKGFFSSYNIYKSKDTLANMGLRLTKSFKLPKNSFNIYFDYNLVKEKLLKSPHTKLLISSDISKEVDSSGISPEDSQLLVQLRSIRHYSFDDYLSAFLSNSKNYSSLISTDKYKANNWASQLSSMKYKYGDKIEGVPDKIIDTVKDVWSKLSDVEIKKSFKYQLSAVRLAVMSQDKKITPKFIDKFKKTYEDTFKERVEWDRYKKLFYAALLDSDKKSAKKFRKDFDAKATERVYREIIFKSTILESKMNRSQELLGYINSLIKGVFMSKCSEILEKFNGIKDDKSIFEVEAKFNKADIKDWLGQLDDLKKDAKNIKDASGAMGLADNLLVFTSFILRDLGLEKEKTLVRATREKMDLYQGV